MTGPLVVIATMSVPLPAVSLSLDRALPNVTRFVAPLFLTLVVSLIVTILRAPLFLVRALFP